MQTARGSQLLDSVRPEAGTTVVFDHDLWHDGEPVTAGTKVVIRSDVMYERDPEHDLDAPVPHDRLGEHAGYVFSVIRRRDGSLASASRDRAILRWHHDGAAWHDLERLTGHTASVTCLAEAAYGALWSGSRDHQLRRWSDGSTVIGRHAGAVLAMVALPDGGMASAGADGAIRLWSTKGQLRSELFTDDGWIASLAVGNGCLWSAAHNGALRSWSLDGSSCTVSREAAPLRAVACFGTTVAWGDDRGDIVIDTNESLRGARGHRGAVCALAFDDAGHLASCGEDGEVRVVDPVTLSSEVVQRHDGFACCLTWTGGAVVSGGYDDQLRVSTAVSRAMTAPL